MKPLFLTGNSIDFGLNTKLEHILHDLVDINGEPVRIPLTGSKTYKVTAIQTKDGMVTLRGCVATIPINGGPVLWKHRCQKLTITKQKLDSLLTNKTLQEDKEDEIFKPTFVDRIVGLCNRIKKSIRRMLVPN